MALRKRQGKGKAQFGNDGATLGIFDNRDFLGFLSRERFVLFFWTSLFWEQ
jgi:hypothetical protein